MQVGEVGQEVQVGEVGQEVQVGEVYLLKTFSN